MQQNNGAIRLTSHQSEALEAIQSFLQDDTQDAFVLRGSAGTGKTTLVAQLVKVLEDLNLSCALLAPTGRAARILGSKVKGARSSTIHREIYALERIEVNETAETANDPGLRLIFPLKSGEPSCSLFVVDESSMVGDKENHGDTFQFGSGRLLSDLVTFARVARPGRTRDHLTKLLFVGDPAQLPPVGEKNSPALSDHYLNQEFNLSVSSFDLHEVLRQAQGSAILDRATELRDDILASRFNRFSLRSSLADIEQIDASAAINHVVSGLEGKDSTVVVVHANATALGYNRSIRQHRWGDATLPIQVGDTLLVNRNTQDLSNGDLVKVVKVAAQAEIVPVGLRGGHQVELGFRQATVAFREANGSVIEFPKLILENLLESRDRGLTPIEQRALLVHFRNRHPGLSPKSAEFRLAIKADPYFNALQVKYGYAMTCHKAQGGEWNRVVVDFEAGTGTRNEQFFRWAYTAITRAAEKLFVVNPPEFSAVSGMAWAQQTGHRPAAMAEGEVTDYTADADWNRLSFSKSLAPLMPTHQRLRAAWSAQGFQIEQLQHLQYCERYLLVRDGRRAAVQYHYDKKFQMSRSSGVPGTAHDDDLQSEALLILRSLTGNDGFAPSDPFIDEFIERLDAALARSSIRRTHCRFMPYRVRMGFADARRKGDIDFTYDGSGAWTGAQEVGAAGSSYGLYEEIQRLMIADGEDLQ